MEFDLISLRVQLSNGKLLAISAKDASFIPLDMRDQIKPGDLVGAKIIGYTAAKDDGVTEAWPVYGRMN